VCAREPAQRAAALGCLDAVVAREEAVATAVERAKAPRVEAGQLLVDPAICAGAHPPRLARSFSPVAIDVFAAWLRSDVIGARETRDAIGTLARDPSSEPCASAMADALRALVDNGVERIPQLTAAETALQRCDDDRTAADVAVLVAKSALDAGFLDADTTARVRRAEPAVERVQQVDLTAELDELRMILAARADNIDEATARGTAAIAGYAARGRVRSQLAASQSWLEQQLIDSDVGTVDVPGELAQWRQQAVAALGERDRVVQDLDRARAMWRWRSGELAAADAALDAMTPTSPQDTPRALHGRVVDDHHQPVVGATVAVGTEMTGDAITAAMASAKRRVVTTGDDGAFAFEDAPQGGVIVAQLGTRRSPPKPARDGDTLALERTHTVEGRVELAGKPAVGVSVMLRDRSPATELRYAMIAPLRADGSFTLDGVVDGAYSVLTLTNPYHPRIETVDVAVKGDDVHGVRISLARTERTQHVLVRSTVGTPVAAAQVFIVPGHIASTNAKVFNATTRTVNVRLARPIENEHAPGPILAKAKPGDLFATMTEVPSGEVSACAVGVPANFTDPALAQKMIPKLEQIEVRCVPIGATDEVVVIEVPPFPRLD